MARSSVRFERGDGYWVAERDSVGFTGETDLGLVEFLIAAEALTHMLNPDLDTIDSGLASRRMRSSRPTSTGSPSSSS
jgi:hypothetical protein